MAPSRTARRPGGRRNSSRVAQIDGPRGTGRNAMSAPNGLRICFRTGAWCVRHYRIVGGTLLVLWLRAALRSWLAVGGVAVIVVLCVLTGWVVLHRHGSAGDLRSLARLLRDRSANSYRGGQHRKHVIRRWPLACEAGGIARGKRYPPLSRIKVRADGSVRALVHVGSVGRSNDTLRAGIHEMADTIGCREIVVTPTRPGRASLEFYWGDVLSRVFRLPDLPPAARGRASFGVHEDGSAASIGLDTSVLIGGVPGSGKSGVVQSLLASIRLSGTPVRLRVIDPAGGVEMQALEDIAPLKRGKDDESITIAEPPNTEPFSVHEYTPRVTEAGDVVRHAHRAMSARLASMKANGVRKHVPTIAEPLDIIIIDEMLLLSEILKKGSASEFGEILTIGRKAGFVVWGCSQLTQIDALGRTRDLFPQRIALLTPSREATDAILKDRAEASGARCSQISRSTPGVGYMTSDGMSGLRRFRTILITDEQTRQIATGTLPGIRAATTGEKRHALYRCWNAGGELLYVGQTNNFGRRTDQHAAQEEWWQEIDNQTVEWFYAHEIDAAEVAAITLERPRYNVQHNKRRRTAANGKAA